MINSIEIVVLPIGEFDSDLTRHEFESMIEVIHRLCTVVFIAEAVSDEEEASQSARILLDKDPDLLLLIPLRGLSARSIEQAALTSHIPVLIWPIQGRFALPSSALATGALQESSIPVELFYAPPDYPGSIERLGCITRAAKAFTRIRKSRIGIIGKLFPNLVSCQYDPAMVNSRLSVEVIPIPYSEIRDWISHVADHKQEIDQLHQAITSSYEVNLADIEHLDGGIHLHLALKQMAKEQNLNGIAAECWTGLPEQLGLNPCMGFVEDEYTLACEGDVMLCISLLIVKYLTGTSAYNGDLFDLNPDGILSLVHCGAPAGLASNKNEVILAKSQLALERGFITLTCRPPLSQGFVTLFRYYGQECDKMHVASGELLSSEQSPNSKVTISLAGNCWSFLEQCFGNHYIVVAGDIRKELKLLCRWLGITIFET